MENRKIEKEKTCHEASQIINYADFLIIEIERLIRINQKLEETQCSNEQIRKNVETIGYLVSVLKSSRRVQCCKN